ncbi:MAG TPA: MFS transporter [Nevskiaceae bacterium]|nr:MFS transporter [Nevskiaceae bacterium]
MSGTAASRFDALHVYAHPRVRGMLFLGFSAGLPFLLVFSTLSAWLTQAGIARATIGMLSWIGISYSIKFFWSPVVDRARLPLLTNWLGRRRSWMLLGQCGIAAGLCGIALHDPAADLEAVVWCALLVAFSSSTQDIAIDAWRIEAAPASMQGAMAAAYQFGYRIAMLAASAGALWLAGEYGWHLSYAVMAVLVAVGLCTTLLVGEPQAQVSRDTLMREARVLEFLETRAHWPEQLRRAGGWIIGAVVCPFVDFFARNGAARGALILALVGTFYLPYITMGVMTNPFYLDLGFSLQQIAAVAKGYGIVASLLGAFLGGIGVVRLGALRCMAIGALLVMFANLTYSALALLHQPTLAGLALIVSVDNIAYNFAAAAFVAYLSGLTNVSYTATQYALFSSLFNLPGKIIAGGSGALVDALGYAPFFIYTALLGIPALLVIAAITRKPTPPAAAA